MESDSRELELNFDDSSQSQPGDLAEVRDELAGEMASGEEKQLVYSAPDDLIIEEDPPEEEIVQDEEFLQDLPEGDYKDDIPEEDIPDEAPVGDDIQETQELNFESSETVETADSEAAVAESAAPAAVCSDPSMLLRSRQPVNRPAGTPPLENSQEPEPVTAMEMVIAGKSYGVALRMLREQRNLSYKELEQITYIQPRFLEALENEDMSLLPPVYVIAYIRTLCRYYKVSDETSQSLVAKLKNQLEYVCNDELMNTLDVDRSGELDNERKLKNIMTALIGGAVGLIALIVLIVVFATSCGGESQEQISDNEVSPEQVENSGSFDPGTVDALLQKPVLELPKLPVAE